MRRQVSRRISADHKPAAERGGGQSSIVKITNIEAIPLERNLEHVFKGGTYEITSRYTLVTEVHIDDGVIGQTFGGDEVKTQKEIVALINGPFRELLIGENLFDFERNWDSMFRCTALDSLNRSIHTLDLANRSVLMQAISAVDIALWDAMGKTLGLPVYRLLGGYRTAVPVMGIGGYYQEGKGEKEFAEELRSHIRAGLAGIKMKVGRLSVADDAERVRQAREIVGDTFTIACDANQGWTVEQAIEFCKRIQGLRVRWIEEPVVWYDQLKGLAAVRASGIPVCAGQGEISRFGCRDLMLANAVDILNVDVTIAGGITEWRRIAYMAGMMNVSMGHHEEPQIALHLLAAVPHSTYVEIFPDPNRDPLWFELPCEQPRISQGLMYLPQTHGIGIPLRADVIERYRAGCLQPS
jgi:L-alanine-DL-glutamate epimerase-like enolase superfamily enzyme